ncbi:hypothetical protein MJO29_012172 [Puccinia striiformis f. sp. tritici]|nr:hypothetical protein MJO29_012172 [Puccinia striiformis f. sp. tritici]
MGFTGSILFEVKSITVVIKPRRSQRPWQASHPTSSLQIFPKPPTIPIPHPVDYRTFARSALPQDAVIQHVRDLDSASHTGQRQSKVDIMIAPWDNVVGAYDCSNTQHKKPTCCSNKSDMPATMDNIVWKRNCKEINGADIK